MVHHLYSRHSYSPSARKEMAMSVDTTVYGSKMITIWSPWVAGSPRPTDDRLVTWFVTVPYIDFTPVMPITTFSTDLGAKVLR